jgi:cell division inhibitor SepF
MNLAKPYNDDEDDYVDFQPKKAEEVPVAPKTPAQARNSYAGFDERRDSGNKVVNIHATAQLQVVLVKPERFETAAEIADHLRERRTVVLN